MSTTPAAPSASAASSVPVAAHSITAPAATAQRELHSLYRRVPNLGDYGSMTAIEERWILPKARAYEASAPRFGSAA